MANFIKPYNDYQACFAVTRTAGAIAQELNLDHR